MGRLEVVEYLTANGADPKLEDNYGKTAYDHTAARFREVRNHLLPLTPNRADLNLVGEKVAKKSSCKQM